MMGFGQLMIEAFDSSQQYSINLESFIDSRPSSVEIALYYLIGAKNHRCSYFQEYIP